MSRGGWSIWSSDSIRREGRRGLLRGTAGLAALMLGGCGFRPLHAPGGAAGAEPGVAADLAATRIAFIPERFGQLVRRGLQQRLGTGGVGEPKWELQVVPALSVDAIGVQRDGSITRVRYLATANWSLMRIAPREVVANGFERSLDAYNIQPNQYFAGDSSREATERRLAEQIADEVVLRLAMRLRSLRDGQAPRLIEPVAPPPVMAVPAVMPSALGGALGTPSPGLEGGGLGGGIGGPLSVPR